MPTSQEQNKQTSPLHIVRTILGLAIGYYAGLFMLAPAVIIGVFAFIAYKAMPNRRNQALLFALVAGHVGWMIMGCMLLHSWSASIGEIIVLPIVLLWVFLRCNRWSAGILATLISAEFCYAVYQCFVTSFGTDIHKGFVVHAVLYLAAITQCLPLLFPKEEKQSTDPNQDPLPSSVTSAPDSGAAGM